MPTLPCTHHSCWSVHSGLMKSGSEHHSLRKSSLGMVEWYFNGFYLEWYFMAFQVQNTLLVGEILWTLVRQHTLVHQNLICISLFYTATLWDEVDLILKKDFTLVADCRLVRVQTPWLDFNQWTIWNHDLQSYFIINCVLLKNIHPLCCITNRAFGLEHPECSCI